MREDFEKARPGTIKLYAKYQEFSSNNLAQTNIFCEQARRWISDMFWNSLLALRGLTRKSIKSPSEEIVKERDYHYDSLVFILDELTKESDKRSCEGCKRTEGCSLDQAWFDSLRTEVSWKIKIYLDYFEKD